MGLAADVKRHVLSDGFSGLHGAFVGVQIDLVAFDAPSELFNKHVVSPAGLAVHSDSDFRGFECLGKFQAGKLPGLIAVRNLWCPIFGDDLLERCDAKVGFPQISRQI